MSQRIDWTSGSAGDTARLGAALASWLGPGDLVLVRGDLGTGKTTLTRGLGRGLGVTARIISPTFALAQRYEGRIPLLHIDAYRLRGADDEEFGLLLDGAADALTVVEWPERLGAALWRPRVTVELRHDGGDRRLVALEGQDHPTRERLAQTVADLRARHLHPEP